MYKYTDGNFDKFYTPQILVERCLDELIGVVSPDDIHTIIEPSAGDGSFLEGICTRFPNCNILAMDIAPDNDLIAKKDYLEFSEPYTKGILVVGNPPFGHSNSLIISFYKKSIEFADYIAFVLPISQYKFSPQLYEFDLISSIDLGKSEYSGTKLHCCFNIYKRPESGLNNKPDYKLQAVEIVELRRGQKSKPLPENYDFSLCNFGAGCFGKIPEYEGQFCQELYFYVKDGQFHSRIKELLEFDTVREFAKNQQMTSKLKVSKMRFLKYLKDNIPDIY